MPVKHRFVLLGPVAAYRDGDLVDTGARQQQAVLAALLLHAGRQVSTQRLVDGLWGDEPPATAVATVRTYVSRIRELLGEDRAALVSEAGGYALRVPPESVDVLE
ncbi:MAG: AfsR/SARP family transcriptional regulator, partial [Nonomuraea sp.]|nr:AfsR/SARP family transcriptional regulator [Nonomuraea sp.]